MKCLLCFTLVLAACAPAATNAPPPRQPATAEMLEGQRISGSPYVPLPPDTLSRLKRARIRKFRVKVLLCLDERGVPFKADIEQSSGDAKADLHIHETIAEWRYRPYAVNGKPVRVCFRVGLNYTIL